MRWRSPSGRQARRARLEGVEGGAVGGVADRVHAHGPARRGGRAHHLGQPLAGGDLHARAVEQPGGGRAERAVHEQLEVAEPQHVVPEARAQPDRAQLGQPLGGQRLPHAQRQLATLVQALEDLEGPHPAVLVVHGGHAARRGDAQPGAAGLDHLVDARQGVAVAEGPGRVLAQHAQRLAVRPALDHAAGHLERRVGALQRRAAQPQRVVVAGHQGHRHARRHAVERGGAGRLGPVAGAPAGAAQPAAGRHGRDGGGHALERLVQRVRALEAHLALSQRPGGEVHVRVVEAGQHAGAAEVHAARLGSRRFGDAPGAHGQPLEHRPGGVERAHRPVFKAELAHGGRRLTPWGATHSRSAARTWRPR